MSWNYRLVKALPDGPVIHRRDPDADYSIREVYYSGEGDTRLSWTSTGVAAGGATLDELRHDLERQMLAWTRPVLVVRGDTLIAEVPIEEADTFVPGMRRTR